MSQINTNDHQFVSQNEINNHTKNIFGKVQLWGQTLEPWIIFENLAGIKLLDQCFFDLSQLELWKLLEKSYHMQLNLV